MVKFSYPASIDIIEQDMLKKLHSVVLTVSINGKDMVIRCPYDKFNFHIQEGMHIIVDGIEENGKTQLVFHPSEPFILNDEQEQLLKDVVAAFKEPPPPPEPPPIVKKTAFGKVLNQAEIDAWRKQHSHET